MREIRRFRNRQVIVDSVTEFPLAPVGGDSIPVKIERFDIGRTDPCFCIPHIAAVPQSPLNDDPFLAASVPADHISAVVVRITDRTEHDLLYI